MGTVDRMSTPADLDITGLQPWRDPRVATRVSTLAQAGVRGLSDLALREQSSAIEEEVLAYVRGDLGERCSERDRVAMAALQVLNALGEERIRRAAQRLIDGPPPLVHTETLPDGSGALRASRAVKVF